LPARILFTLPALGAGGSERVVTALANHWAAQKRAIAIATFEAPDKSPYYEIDAGVELFRLDLPATPWPKWRALQRTGARISALRRLFLHHQPTVVVSFLTKMNVMSVFAARGLGVPVVISERNNPRLQGFDSLWAAARAIAYPRAFAFVTMTAAAASFYPPSQRPNTRIIPNPVTLPSGWVDRRGAKTIAAVGRLTRQKRFDRLISAFAAAAGDFPDWTLMIWGEGELRAALEAQRGRLAPDIAARIALPGLTPSPGAWIESADLLVLSSDYEGWPNVIAEAMAAELPVLAFDCECGVKELVANGKTGRLVPAGDVEALTAGLRELMGDGALRRRFAQNARAEAARYAIENVAAQWDDLLAEAAAAKNPRS
jgi:glycosyltransferase involved in cell wall biosynthesis